MRHVPTVPIIASTVVALGTGMMLHEAAHVLAGSLAGGTPTLLTTSEVLGNFRNLSPLGFVALGVSGSLANLVLLLLGGWLLFRPGTSEMARLAAWFLFGVNGMLLTTKMMMEPITGFGDWMTVLRTVGRPTAFRVGLAALGFLGVAIMVRTSATGLGRLLPPGSRRERRLAAGRLLLIGALSGAVLVVGGAIQSPVGTTRSVLLSLGAGLGPFIPLALGLRRIGEGPDTGETTTTERAWPLYALAVALLIAMWCFAGPGIAFGPAEPAA